MSIIGGFLKSGLKDAEKLIEPELTQIKASEAKLAPVASQVNWTALEAEANAFLIPLIQKYAPGVTAAELAMAEGEVQKIVDSLFSAFKKAKTVAK